MGSTASGLKWDTNTATVLSFWDKCRYSDRNSRNTVLRNTRERLWLAQLPLFLVCNHGSLLRRHSLGLSDRLPPVWTRANKGQGMFPWLQQTFVAEEDFGEPKECMRSTVTREKDQLHVFSTLLFLCRWPRKETAFGHKENLHQVLHCGMGTACHDCCFVLCTRLLRNFTFWIWFVNGI